MHLKKLTLVHGTRRTGEKFLQIEKKRIRIIIFESLILLCKLGKFHFQLPIDIDVFYENLTDKEITIESCLYDLMIFSSQEWVPIENALEYVEEPTATSFAGLICSILATIFLVYTENRRTKRKKT